MIDHLTNLFKHNNWATERTAKSILQTKTVLPDTVKLLSHIVSAQQIWLNRITGQKSEITSWDNFTIQECINKSIEATSK